MKKVVIALLFFLGASVSLWCQQKKVGDIVMDYEFPAVVVYVDKTGEHGLLLGLHNYPTAYPSGQAGGLVGLVAVAVKKEYVRDRDICSVLSNFYPETMSLELQNKYYTEQYPSGAIIKRDKNGDIKMIQGQISIESIKGFDKKIAFAAYSAVEACGLKNGQDIASFINEYCKSNNIDKSIYFRSQFWADCLGNGWFIPGDEELELMCPALCGYRLGEEYAKSKEKKYKERFDKQYKSSLAFKIREQIGNLGYYSPMILSSNMSVYKKVGEYHTLCVAGQKQFGSKFYKPIISSGFVDIDKKLYGKFGEWKCESSAGFFSEMCCSYSFPIPTLPVKKF